MQRSALCDLVLLLRTDAASRRCAGVHQLGVRGALATMLSCTVVKLLQPTPDTGDGPRPRPIQCHARVGAGPAAFKSSVCTTSGV